MDYQEEIQELEYEGWQEVQYGKYAGMYMKDIFES